MGPRRSAQLRLACLLALAGSWPLAARANVTAVGTTGASFLKLGSGARPEALSGSYAALADDAAGIAYNPAGMSQMLNDEIQATHTEWLQGLRYENASGVFSLGGGGMLGASIDYLSVPSIQGTEQVANFSEPDLISENYKNTGSFSPYDLAVGVAYSRPLYPGLLLGARVQVLSENLAGQSDYGASLDFGGIVRTPLPGLNLGLSMKNLGTPLKAVNKAYDLPLDVLGGASYRCLDDKLLLLIETDLPDDNAQAFSWGAEYSVGGFFYPRMGWRWDGIFNPWSLGLGIKFGHSAFDMSVVPFGDLGLTYRASLSYRFGDPEAVLATEAPYLSNGEAAKPVSFEPKVTAPDKVAAWAFYIYDSSKPAKLVRQSNGRGAFEGPLVWDGKRSDGSLAPEGIYYAVLSLRYSGGKVINSPYQRLELNNQAPQLDLALDAASVNPEAPGEAFVPATFKISLKSGRGTAKWRLEILDPQERIFRTYAGPGLPPPALTWDGQGEHGEALVSGEIYQARLWAVDPLGRESLSPARVSFKALLYR